VIVLGATVDGAIDARGGDGGVGGLALALGLDAERCDARGGSNARAVGAPGSPITNPDAKATGEAGGCGPVDGTGGTGGDANATGGHGGIAPDGNGGRGGNAIAIAGRGGDGTDACFTTSRAAEASRITRAGSGGPGGLYVASGGDGGSGIRRGGDGGDAVGRDEGGDGGSATPPIAQGVGGSNARPHDPAEPFAVVGGNGGFGDVGGNGGNATAEILVGDPGGTCGDGTKPLGIPGLGTHVILLAVGTAAGVSRVRKRP
jgi:hypothetical protein